MVPWCVFPQDMGNATQYIILQNPDEDIKWTKMIMLCNSKPGVVVHQHDLS